MEITLELAIIRYAVVCEKWKSISGAYPSLDAFLCGWFMRKLMGDKFIDVKIVQRDSYRSGWNEADTMININERKTD